MRCPDCNKFTGLEMQDPEVESEPTLDGTTVSATVKIVRNCADCGNTLKEATLEMSADIPEDIVDAHTDEEADNGTPDGEPKHELTVEAPDDWEQIEDGGGRYAKSYYGARVEFTIRCKCQQEKDEPLYSGTLEDKVAASEMDEAC